MTVYFRPISNLCSVISVKLDVTVGNGDGNDVERYDNGMISSVFISYDCAGKLPLHISVSLKAVFLVNLIS